MVGRGEGGGEEFYMGWHSFAWGVTPNVTRGKAVRECKKRAKKHYIFSEQLPPEPV